MATETRSAMVLRLPPALKEQVREIARENKRSLTREIEVACERHVQAAQPAPATPVEVAP